MEKERIKEAIAKMEKGLNNPQIGDAQKDMLRKKIALLKEQVKEEEPKAKAKTAAPKKKPMPKAPEKKIKNIDLSVAKAVEPKGGAAKRVVEAAAKPKFKVGDVVMFEDGTLEMKIDSFKKGYKGAFIYSGHFVSKPSEKFVESEKDLVLAKTPKRTKKVITSTKRKKAAATETPKRKKRVITSAKRKKAAMKEVPDTTKRGLAADKKREALPVGKRVSKGGANQHGKSSGGNVYYEYRRNRADRNAKRKFAKGGEMEKLTAQTYTGKDAISGNINEIAFYTAENGTIIQLVSVRDGSSVSGAMYYVTINGRGLYAREYREDAYELYRDEKAKYNTKMSKGGEIMSHIDDRLKREGDIMNPQKKQRLVEIRGRLLRKEKLNEKDTNVLKNEFNYLFEKGGSTYQGGGEIKTLKVGDRIKDKYGYELEVYQVENNKIHVQAPSGSIHTYYQKDFDNGEVELFWSNKTYQGGGEIDNYVVTNGEMFLSNRGGKFILTDNVEMAYTYSKKEAEKQVKHAESLSKDNSKFKVESFSMYNKYAKGGGVGEIDMVEVEQSAKYYTDKSRWSTPPTITRFESEIAEYKELRRKLDNKQITPSKVIGTGYKPNLARPLAYHWLDKQILIAEKAIELLKESGEQMAKGGQIRSKSALAKDRKYTSDEPHELRYRFVRKSKVKRYDTKMASGGEVGEYLIYNSSDKKLVQDYLKSKKYKKQYREDFDNIFNLKIIEVPYEKFTDYRLIATKKTAK